MKIPLYVKEVSTSFLNPFNGHLLVFTVPSNTHFPCVPMPQIHAVLVCWSVCFISGPA